MSLEPHARALIARSFEMVRLRRGEILFEVGEEVRWSHFPGPGTVVSLQVLLADGKTVETATIGNEGAAGGIVSSGRKPAFARALVQIGGPAARLPTAALEEIKASSPAVRKIFSRYADFLLAQVMQSVACTTFHSLEARCCRWLLTTHDRVGRDDIPLTQAALADMLGVQRTTVSAVARALQAQGLIRYSRGRIALLDRAAVERNACECYRCVERHFEIMLPELRVGAAAADVVTLGR